jgi:hypothetical protein
MQLALEKNERLDYVFLQARSTFVLVWCFFIFYSFCFMFSKYDTPSYLTSREVDPLYSRLLIEECDDTGEVTQMLWAGLTKGNEVLTDLTAVNKLLGSIDISRKVMFFHVFMKIIHLPHLLSSFGRRCSKASRSTSRNMTSDCLTQWLCTVG